MVAVAMDRLAGRSLVSGDLFERLTARVVLEDGHDPDLAARVVDQALAFLGACAGHRRASLSPSRVVDVGWHAFVLHTREYREFCARVAGRFIDHVPTAELRAGSAAHTLAMRRAIAAIRAAGYAVDDELWLSSGKADCTGCANGCHDDPPPIA